MAQMYVRTKIYIFETRLAFRRFPVEEPRPSETFFSGNVPPLSIVERVLWAKWHVLPTFRVFCLTGGGAQAQRPHQHQVHPIKDQLPPRFRR